MHLATSPGVEITVRDVVSSPSPAFESFLALSDVTARLRRYSFVITNASATGLVGLSVRWTYTDASGKEQVFDLASDSFFWRRPPLASPGAEVLAMPGMLLPAAVAQSGFAGPDELTLRSFLDPLDRSPRVTAEVDTAIFDDGEALGPDRAGFITSVQARYAAAANLAREIRSVMGSGGDVKALLAGLRSHGPARVAGAPWGEPEFEQLWLSRLADQLLRVADRGIQQTLEGYESARPPRIIRKK